MAELFLADQTLDDGSTRPIVVKRALPGADDAYLAYLDRERQVLGALDSPRIVRLLGGEGDHLLLEYVEGADLAAVLGHLRKRGKALSLGAALAAIAGLLEALADLHRADLGLVHRDVNPANILVRAADGAVKLADLGVVHTSVGAKSTLGGLKGTLAYMAPEQLQGRPVDKRSDLYAAGLVVYEVLTGVAARPAGMIGVAELIAARSTLPAPPSGLRANLSEALDDVVLAALAPAPDDRPADARGWLDDLLAAAGALPDSTALAEATRGVERAVASPVRTVQASGAVVTPVVVPPADVEPSAPPIPAQAASNSSLPWIGLLAVGAVAVIVALQPPDKESSPPPPRAVTPSVAVPIEPTAAPEEAQPPPQPTEPAPQPTLATVALQPPELSEARRPRHAVTADFVTPRVIKPRITSKPQPKAPTPATPTALRLEIRSAGAGPVHVSGAGTGGLAPRTTSPLGDGAHVLRLVGGARMLKATVRITRKADRLSATIGAPAGRFYSVRCGGGKERNTPVVGLPIRARLSCTLSTADGARMAFALRRVGL